MAKLKEKDLTELLCMCSRGECTMIDVIESTDDESYRGAFYEHCDIFKFDRTSVEVAEKWVDEMEKSMQYNLDHPEAEEEMWEAIFKQGKEERENQEVKEAKRIEEMVLADLRNPKYLENIDSKYAQVVALFRLQHPKAGKAKCSEICSIGKEKSLYWWNILDVLYYTQEKIYGTQHVHYFLNEKDTIKKLIEEAKEYWAKNPIE